MAMNKNITACREAFEKAYGRKVHKLWPDVSFNDFKIGWQAAYNHQSNLLPECVTFIQKIKNLDGRDVMMIELLGLVLEAQDLLTRLNKESL